MIKSRTIFICYFVVCILSITEYGNTQTNENGSSIEGSNCNFSNGRIGKCQKILECPAILSNIRAGIKSIRKCENSGQNSELVCCPVTPRISSIMCNKYTDLLRTSGGPFPLLPPGFIDDDEPSEIYCNPDLNPLISAGRDAQVGEFPHVVAIGYNVSKTPWRCGAVLISDEFLLTAAHCLNNPSAGNPVKVLLGDINLSQNKSPSNSRLLLDVAEIIPYPGYRPPQTYHDLALIRLSKKVQLSRSILPACLAQPEDDILKGMSKKNFSAAGWGVLGTGEAQSDVLQVVNLEGFPHKSCDAFYSEVPAKELKFPSGILRSQICAGDKVGRKDTCKGDSGGPLWVHKDKRCVFYVIGITSVGPNQCGEKVPGIYSNVLSYLDWIESKVWPDFHYDTDNK